MGDIKFPFNSTKWNKMSTIEINLEMIGLNRDVIMSQPLDKLLNH